MSIFISIIMNVPQLSRSPLLPALHLSTDLGEFAVEANKIPILATHVVFHSVTVPPHLHPLLYSDQNEVRSSYQQRLVEPLLEDLVVAVGKPEKDKVLGLKFDFEGALQVDHSSSIQKRFAL